MIVILTGEEDPDINLLWLLFRLELPDVSKEVPGDVTYQQALPLVLQILGASFSNQRFSEFLFFVVKAPSFEAREAHRY